MLSLHNGKTIIAVISIVIVAIFLTGVDPVSAVSYDSKASAKSKINKTTKSHKKTLTFYTKKKYNPSSLLNNAAFSLNKSRNKIIAEGKTYRGDYNLYSNIKNCNIKQWKITKGKKKYYKYKYTFTYTAGKKKSDYIDARSRAIAKSYKKGSAQLRASGICTWIAKNMNYKITNKYTIYEAYKTKQGQCKHYALMFYKIAKEAGLEVRIVRGKARSNPFSPYESHMWCIVKSGSKWYQVDPTWADAGNSISARWIMKGKNDLFFKLTHSPSRLHETQMTGICPVAP